jgi:hypothetical protein
MSRLTRRGALQPPLKAETIAILLAGWAAPDAPEASEDGFDGGFLELYEEGGIAELWGTYDRYLLATAARWGWTPQVPTRRGLLFYGEAAALGEVPEV